MTSSFDAQVDQTAKAAREADETLQELTTELEALREKCEEYRGKLRSISVADREFLIYEGTIGQRERYFQLAKHVKNEILEERRRLGRQFIEEHAASTDPRSVDFALDRAKAHGSINYSDHPLVQAVVEEVREYADGLMKSGKDLPSKGSLDFLGSSKKEFSQESAIFKFATSPTALIPVIRYYDALPIISSFGATLARNDAFHRKSSQRLHLDPEDRTQIKLFLYVTDVDENSGPFMAVDAETSKCIHDKEDFLLDRLDDSVVPEGAIHPYVGPAGTCVYCDTCRCLHAGGRQGDRHRILVSIEYNLPTNLWSPLFGPDGARLNRTAALKTDPDDALMNALFGRTLT